MRKQMQESDESDSLSHSLSFILETSFAGLLRQLVIGHNDTYTFKHKNNAVAATDESSF